jgi:hypothetical protein
MPAVKVYPTLYLLTEPPWLLSTRYYLNGGRDPAFVVGSAVVTWLTWVSATAPGYWLGAWAGDSHRFGFDMIMPAFFVAMLVSVAGAAPVRRLDRGRRGRGSDGATVRRFLVCGDRRAGRQPRWGVHR